MKNKKMVREEWVDIAKGIVILLVIFEHSLLDSEWFLAKSILLFHMPFFFFISGYCYKFSSSINHNKYRQKNIIKTLKIVFLIGLMSFSFYILKDLFKHNFSIDKLIRYASDFIYGNSVNGHTFGGGTGLSLLC